MSSTDTQVWACRRVSTYYLPLSPQYDLFDLRYNRFLWHVVVDNKAGYFIEKRTAYSMGVCCFGAVLHSVNGYVHIQTQMFGAGNDDAHLKALDDLKFTVAVVHKRLQWEITYV